MSGGEGSGEKRDALDALNQFVDHEYFFENTYSDEVLEELERHLDGLGLNEAVEILGFHIQSLAFDLGGLHPLPNWEDSAQQLSKWSEEGEEFHGYLNDEIHTAELTVGEIFQILSIALIYKAQQ